MARPCVSKLVNSVDASAQRQYRHGKPCQVGRRCCVASKGQALQAQGQEIEDDFSHGSPGPDAENSVGHVAVGNRTCMNYTLSFSVFWAGTPFFMGT